MIADTRELTGAGVVTELGARTVTDCGRVTDRSARGCAALLGIGSGLEIPRAWAFWVAIELVSLNDWRPIAATVTLLTLCVASPNGWRIMGMRTVLLRCSMLMVCSSEPLNRALQGLAQVEEEPW